MQVGNQNIQIKKAQFSTCLISWYSWQIAEVHCIFTYHLYKMKSNIKSTRLLFFNPQSLDILLLELVELFFSLVVLTLVWMRTFCPQNWKVSSSANCLASITITVSPSGFSHGYHVEEDPTYRRLSFFARNKETAQRWDLCRSACKGNP